VRVLFDVLGAPARSGGMRQYAEQLIAAWRKRWPDDTIVVVGDHWVAQLSGRLEEPIRHVQWDSDRFVFRSVGQLIAAGLVFRALRCDLIVSTSTLVSPLAPRARRLCIVHDWRHRLRPEEFGAAQRAYRMLWNRSARTARHLISISAKTLEESRRFVPEASHVLVESGHDHARSWNLARPAPGEHRMIVTFGHHANKRPHLVLDAFAQSGLAASRELVVLGARGDLADSLRARAEGAGIGPSVRLPGFVDEGEYRRLISSADAIVMASTDEGFGLPGAEAAWFGIPFVVTSDSGLDRVHAGAFVAEPEASSLAVVLRRAARESGSPRRGTLRRWTETVTEIRDLVGAR
jgi:glycosyltransferase involved in cell wall biosynthesis